MEILARVRVTVIVNDTSSITCLLQILEKIQIKIKIKMKMKIKIKIKIKKRNKKKRKEKKRYCAF